MFKAEADKHVTFCSELPLGAHLLLLEFRYFTISIEMSVVEAKAVMIPNSERERGTVLKAN